MSLNTVDILGVHITSTLASAALREISEIASGEDDDKPVGVSRLRPDVRRDFARDDTRVIFTPNPEFLVEAAEDLHFRELLNRADINLPDGVGLVWAGRVLGTPIKERVSGADVVEGLLEDGNEKCACPAREVRGESGSEGEKWVVGIAGARRGVQEEANELIKRLGKKYPNIRFINLDAPPFTIYHLPFTIVMACHGMKKQEEWILENKDRIKANVFMGVGGSLDFLTGFTKRAPLLMRQVGLEWLWRGLQRPGHWKRIWRAVFVFGWLVFKERLSK